MTKKITIEKVDIDRAIQATWVADGERHCTRLFPVGMESAARAEAMQSIELAAAVKAIAAQPLPPRRRRKTATR